PHPRKVAVVGAGMVGSTFAYALLLGGLVGEIVLIDIDHKRADHGDLARMGCVLP
ncbi:MAG: L-lactate dehydrogenase, partial [Anaerolineae bacterium]|nr:L-lactate dehydrogenase [Anaerolineae bacterium]